MHVDDRQKQLTLLNALSRLKRISIVLEPLFSTRQLEVLAKDYVKGSRYFEAMTHVLHQRELLLMDVPKAAMCSMLSNTDLAIDVAQTFISEPAQRIVIGLKEEGISDKRPNGGPAPSGEHASSQPTVGELAWGALSFGKVCGLDPLPDTYSNPSGSTINGQGSQLSLQDLSIIECAVRYMDSDLDYSFMAHMTEAGAAMVHHVTMTMVAELSIRVDTAITAAARLLIDPEVGGDVNHCVSLLRRGQFPAMWADRYNSN